MTTLQEQRAEQQRRQILQMLKEKRQKELNEFFIEMAQKRK